MSSVRMTLQGSYEEPTANYISMKTNIETINKPRGNEEHISKGKNTAEGIKSRRDEVED